MNPDVAILALLALSMLLVLSIDPRPAEQRGRTVRLPTIPPARAARLVFSGRFSGRFPF